MNFVVLRCGYLWSDFTFLRFVMCGIYPFPVMPYADDKRLSKNMFESHELKPIFNNWFMNSNKRMPHGWQFDESISASEVYNHLFNGISWLWSLIKYFILIWSSLFPTNRLNIRAIESFSMAWKHSNNVRTQYSY